MNLEKTVIPFLFKKAGKIGYSYWILSIHSAFRIDEG